MRRFRQIEAVRPRGRPVAGRTRPKIGEFDGGMTGMGLALAETEVLVMSPSNLVRLVLVIAIALLVPIRAAGQQAPPARSGAQVYNEICATCHGPDGRGGVNLELEKIVAPPDFTDCAFAAREPDRGFLAVAHNGGPARGFSPLMAPWGGTYTEEELGFAVSHLRTFCKDDRWPRGELNLPRPFVTAKAFPEDEAVMSTVSQ
jgi:hypothetical protein